MSVLDWRGGPKPGLPTGEVFDADTGEVIPFVFFLNTEDGRVGRYAAEPGGTFRLEAGRPVKVWETRRVRCSWDEADAPTVVEPCPSR